MEQTKSQQELSDELLKTLQDKLNSPPTDEDIQLIKDWMSTKKITEPVRVMTPLTKEQKEYINLKLSFERMYNSFRELSNTNQIDACRAFTPPKELKHLVKDMPLVEILFHEYMEILVSNKSNQK